MVGYPVTRPDICRWDATIWLKVALKIFTAVADALELWRVHKAGVKYIYHYLDDFAVLGSLDCEECHRHLLCLQSVAADLGVPL